MLNRRLLAYVRPGILAQSRCIATNKPRPIYMDVQATTPLDKRVLDTMMPYLTDKFGNPHSRTHFYGWESEEAVENARREVAQLINADPKEIIFTSGNKDKQLSKYPFICDSNDIIFDIF